MNDAGLIKRYLLGDLQGEERTRFEDVYFSDTERFGELAAEEDDLIDSYVRDRMTESEQRQFEEQFLISPERSSRVDFAHTWYELLRQKRESSGKNPILRWWLPRALFEGTHGWPRVALATSGFFVAVVCGSLLLLQNRKLQIELKQARMASAELQQSHDVLARQLADLVKQSPNVVSKTGGGTELAKVEPPTLLGEPLNLAPGMIRGGKQDVPTLLLPLHKPSVQLQLLLPQDWREHETLDATIRTAEAHQPFFVEAGLSPATSPAERTVILRVPSKLIQAGYYSVSLYRGGADLSGDPIGAYIFRAR
jgi:hypothetical protein